MRRRRQTLAVEKQISNCDDFSTKYNHLLNNMTAITDDNVERIKQLTTALTNAMKSNSGIPCDKEEKITIFNNTSQKVDAAREKVKFYAEEKINEIAALSKIEYFTAADQEITAEPTTHPETTANQEVTADSETLADTETTADQETTTVQETTTADSETQAASEQGDTTTETEQ